MVKIKTKVVLKIREGMSPINSVSTVPRLASDRTSGARSLTITPCLSLVD
ncbi:hypothetical protein L7E55_11710 [Pelotomaculum isophthalicicum JI]|uniref:Uncharacterized protein n=1 Tax=Pelotomaculum isophthalicicum JI TaxID=947010 RepID=A0A9X4H4U0_9FIRM|nr:hypothetical protein [Pelotomaculum isophthalicicum]MDF9409018.1 hypothetical protein [Pelotomaculum isophthalicicum JI]